LQNASRQLRSSGKASARLFHSIVKATEQGRQQRYALESGHLRCTVRQPELQLRSTCPAGWGGCAESWEHLRNRGGERAQSPGTCSGMTVYMRSSVGVTEQQRQATCPAATLHLRRSVWARALQGLGNCASASFYRRSRNRAPAQQRKDTSATASLHFRSSVRAPAHKRHVMVQQLEGNCAAALEQPRSNFGDPAQQCGVYA
jgi:hypothetical protein